jgi:hypothetical protein
MRRVPSHSEPELKQPFGQAEQEGTAKRAGPKEKRPNAGNLGDQKAKAGIQVKPPMKQSPLKRSPNMKRNPAYRSDRT